MSSDKQQARWAQKGSFVAIVITICAVILVMIAYFSYSITEIRNIAPQPYVTIVNNNLGVKVKLLTIKSEMLSYKAAPSSQSLAQLKFKSRIYKSSILQDFRSTRTIKVHEQYGEVKRLAVLVAELESTFTRIDAITLDNESLLNNTLIQLDGLYDRFNAYLSNFVSEVQKNQMQFVLQKESLHNSQYVYLAVILVCALLMVGVISWMYLDQRRLSFNLKRQTREMEEAKSLAEQSATTKARFLANMSHEMRTPLNAIIGLSQKEYYLSSDEQTRNFTALINSSGKHLLKLINSVLDISKIEQGRAKLEIETFAISELITAAKTIFVEMTKQQVEVLFTTDLVDDVQIKADQTKLLQVINNISYNAVKFTSQGLVEIHLSLSEFNLISIRIKDTGIGMTEEQLDKVFDEFTQADDSITREYGGSGLGLSICRSLVQLMNGEMTVTSEPQQGTEFIINIPVEVVERQAIVDEHIKSLGVRVVAHNINVQKAISSELTQLGLFDPDGQLTVYYHSDEAVLEAGLALASRQQDDQVLVIADVQTTLPERQLLFKLNKPYDQFSLIASLVAMRGTSSPSMASPLFQIDPNLKVLLVEDMRVNQLVATKMLSTLGVHWQTVNNGQECLQRLKDERFDIIFMDIQMPVMDGLQALAHIQQQSLAPESVIIALTANTFDSDVQHYLEQGFVDVLAKPFQLESMEKMLNKYQPASARQASSSLSSK
ncbi:ATP-binding protein [Vibrio pacinii]|uniref:ATP-binding protein n=1 Tax=Vibrio pacinii TaxID=170674 RepID=UPI00068C791E